MNGQDLSGGGEAKLRYLDGDFEVLRPGGFVRCALSGEAIALKALRYWSVDRQEAYRDAGLANQARDKALAEGGSF